MLLVLVLQVLSSIQSQNSAKRVALMRLEEKAVSPPAVVSNAKLSTGGVDSGVSHFETVAYHTL